MIVATALGVSWPVITGGFVAYVDNPAHLAELYSLAFDSNNGWSDVGFCGFPVGMLHSPIWYGGLAALAKLGIPLGPVYGMMLWVGLVGPALAIYFVARRTLQPIGAAAIAYMLLIQRPAVVGLGSALSGMWTFYIAAALLILLIDRLSRPCYNGRCIAWLALLVGLIGSTHLFALVPLIAIFGISVILSLFRRAPIVWLGLQTLAFALGAVASAWYWGPYIMSFRDLTLDHQNLTTAHAFARLLLPTDVIDLFSGRPLQIGFAFLADSIPMIVLTGLGVAGAVRVRKHLNAAAVIGLSLALGMLVLVAFVAPHVYSRIAGPLSWRMLYFVRIGLALGAIGALSGICWRLRGRFATAATAGIIAVALLLGSWWGRTVWSSTPSMNDADMMEVRQLWEWLEPQPKEQWGRVYLQNTFATPPLDSKLVRSHVLALSAHMTGVRQLGAWYGKSPFATAWTKSEFGTLYGRFLEPGDTETLLELMKLTNSTHLVVSDPSLAAKMPPSIERLFTAGRFTVFGIGDARSRWIEPMEQAADLQSIDYEVGQIQFRPGESRAGTYLVKAAYHPFWRLAEPSVGTIRRGARGLMTVDIADPGPSGSVTLVFREPAWPKWLTLVGSILIVLLAVLMGSDPTADDTSRQVASIKVYPEGSEGRSRCSQ